MNDTTEYIDAYFNHALEESERLQFEARCSSNEAFAKEVAFYISARGAARETLLQQKTEQWKPAQKASEAITMKPVKRSALLRWMPAAAAACVVLVMAGYFLFYRTTPGRLASDYVHEKYSQLSQNMDGDTKDSIQLGIAEYNNKNYSHALNLFEWVAGTDSTNGDAKKYAGLAYLQMKEYSKALHYFKQLSAMKSAYNAGDMLQASTLLQRNAPGDEEAAKALLQKVVTEQEEGNAVAKKALENW